MRKKLRCDRRGSVMDLFFIVLALFFFAVVILVGGKIHQEFNTRIQASTEFNSDAKTAASTLDGYYSSVIDNSFLFLAIGLSIVAFVLAALVRIHPIFIPFFILTLVFIIVLSGIFSNAFESMSQDPSMVDFTSRLTIVPIIMGYLPLFVGVVGTLLMVIMYKTWSIEQ